MLIIEQIKVGGMGNFTYLVGCGETREACVIDPSGGLDMVLKKARENKLQVKYIFNTHHHYDHTLGNAELQAKTGAAIVLHESDVSALSPPSLKHIAVEKDCEFDVGKIKFSIVHTPGHTQGGLCFHAEGNLFTGDTLFVGDSGRTDLAGGNRPTLGRSLRKLMELFPDDTVVWPGHDLGKTPSTTLGIEKRTNINAREYGFYIAD